MGYQEDKDRIAEWRDGYLASHQFYRADCKSWHLREPGKGSANAFSVTWSYPGTLTLAGDLGELTLTHYSAVPNWWSAVQWLSANSDYDYFLGKSSAEREFDPEGTLQVIVEHLTEAAADLDVGGFKMNSFDRVRFGSFDVNEVFVAKVNPEFVDELRSRLDDGGENEAAEVCNALEMSDYYGSKRWPAQRVIQMACLFRWAEMVEATEEYREAVEKARLRHELLQHCMLLDNRIRLNSEAVVGCGDFIHYLPREANNSTLVYVPVHEAPPAKPTVVGQN